MVNQPVKTVIITGGNTGLGYECAKELAQTQEWYVIIACRDKTRADQAVTRLITETAHKHIEAMKLDLASLASVRQFVEAFSQHQLPPLQAIVCNAGIQLVTGITYTIDGFETTFAVNHLGHFLLLNLLLPQLTPSARIILVSSGTHDPAQRTGMPLPEYRNARLLAQPQLDPAFNITDAGKFGRQAYTTSKLCNILCAYELARRLKTTHPMITVNAFDPGLMPGSGLARDYGIIQRFAWNFILPVLRLFMSNVNTISQSGKALARLVLDPQLATTSSQYFEGFKPIPSSQDSYNEQLAAELWQTSAELVQLNSPQI